MFEERSLEAGERGRHLSTLLVRYCQAYANLAEPFLTFEQLHHSFRFYLESYQVR